MITLEQIMDNLEGMEGELKNLYNDIVVAFEDYQYEGESNIIILKNNPAGTELLACANHRHAPELKILIEKNEDEYIIKEVYTENDIRGFYMVSL
jgi:hypothetical protein